MPPPIGKKSVSADFEEAICLPDLKIRPARKRDRPSPVSIRLDKSEKALLKARAKGKPLGTYIKSCLWGERSEHKKPATREEIAKALGKLGQSGLLSDLTQLANAAHIGALPVTPELQKELFSACDEVKALRNDLLSALGIRKVK